MNCIAQAIVGGKSLIWKVSISTIWACFGHSGVIECKINLGKTEPEAFNINIPTSAYRKCVYVVLIITAGLLNVYQT